MSEAQTVEPSPYPSPYPLPSPSPSPSTGASGATFVEGSFVPPDYRDQVDLLMSDYMTPTEGADAYAEIGLDLADFDLVYAYPWPGEEDWLIELVRRHGGPRTRLMIYTVRDGYEII